MTTMLILMIIILTISHITLYARHIYAITTERKEKAQLKEELLHWKTVGIPTNTTQTT